MQHRQCGGQKGHFTVVTTASRTSPLNGRNTIAVNLSWKVTTPAPSRIRPSPMEVTCVTQITKPYLPEQEPSTFWISFCVSSSLIFGPKCLGYSSSSLSISMWKNMVAEKAQQRRICSDLPCKYDAALSTVAVACYPPTRP
eukprot:6202053-Pleurochrysis_carterae.AAC.1